MKTKLSGLLALAALPIAALAQFADTFTTLDPAWIPNRYDPAGFESVVFDGDNRLRLTIDEADSAANRPALFSNAFYDIQGRQHPGGVTGRWSISAEVYVASAVNTATGQIVGAELWGHSGPTPTGGDYLTLGFTNASPTDAYDINAADRTFRFQAYDATLGNWVDLGVPGGFLFDTWHTLSGVSTGATFAYYIDGNLVYTKATAAGDDLESVIVQGANYGATGSYAVYWDNVTASAIPEPAAVALLAAVAALGLVIWHRRQG
ncbi:MAG: hypothetical protein PSV13_20150 [Lacunisphaera sp.]|nr:hypothetical protein [Lacunisphaera sp.]